MKTLDKMLKNIKNIKNINYLLEVIYKAGIQKEKIVFIPNFERSTYAKVIEEINYKKDLLYIKINIFRLKFFSDLELIYFNHESKKDFNAVKLIETTISELLNIYLSNFLNIFSYQKK